MDIITQSHNVTEDDVSDVLNNHLDQALFEIYDKTIRLSVTHTRELLEKTYTESIDKLKNIQDIRDITGGQWMILTELLKKNLIKLTIIGFTITIEDI